MSIQAVSNLKPIKVPNQSMALNPGMNSNPMVLNTTRAFTDDHDPIENKPSSLMTDLIKKFETNVKNKSDLNDTVTVPRTIFKGYLGFMAGTALGAVSSLIKVGEKGQHKKLKTLLGIASATVSLLGTWCFVRPYVIKDSQKKN